MKSFVKDMEDKKIIYKDGKLYRKYNERWDKWLNEPIEIGLNNTSGYIYVGKRIDGEKVNVLSHRLIWSYFNFIPDNELTINHINGNKQDNRIENLELTTQSGNVQHAFDTGLKHGVRGEKNNLAKLTDNQVKEIKVRRKNGVKVTQLAEEYGVSFQHIYRILKNERRQWGVIK